ncbi:predicted protein [Enterococcus gallinarum EG2]|nr:predicted protein [Enterococcus gallinarum EG2]
MKETVEWLEMTYFSFSIFGKPEVCHFFANAFIFSKNYLMRNPFLNFLRSEKASCEKRNFSLYFK